MSSLGTRALKQKRAFQFSITKAHPCCLVVLVQLFAVESRHCAQIKLWRRWCLHIRNTLSFSKLRTLFPRRDGRGKAGTTPTQRAMRLFNILGYLQSANYQQQNLLFLSLVMQWPDRPASQPSKAMTNGSQRGWELMAQAPTPPLEA